jgi:hypothetical protein
VEDNLLIQSIQATINNMVAFEGTLRANLEWAIPDDHDFHESNLGPNLGAFNGNLEINSRANLGANLEWAIPEDQDFHASNLGPNLGAFDRNLEINSRANLSGRF